MQHFTHIKTWVEDEEGNQPEFEFGVNVAVYDIEDGDVQFRSIEYAQVTDPDGPWPKCFIPLGLLPAGCVEQIKFEIDEHKYEIADECREVEDDYHYDLQYELQRERRYEEGR